nr:hypothetical protein Itr_chr08CG13650 [Ipomoea trifida]
MRRREGRSRCCRCSVHCRYDARRKQRRRIVAASYTLEKTTALLLIALAGLHRNGEGRRLVLSTGCCRREERVSVSPYLTTGSLFVRFVQRSRNGEDEGDGRRGSPPMFTIVDVAWGSDEEKRKMGVRCRY